MLSLLLYTAKPENGEPQVIETPKVEEREGKSVEKEEMMEGVLIIQSAALISNKDYKTFRKSHIFVVE